MMDGQIVTGLGWFVIIKLVLVGLSVAGVIAMCYFARRGRNDIADGIEELLDEATMHVRMHRDQNSFDAQAEQLRRMAAYPARTAMLLVKSDGQNAPQIARDIATSSSS